MVGDATVKVEREIVLFVWFVGEVIGAGVVVMPPKKIHIVLSLANVTQFHGLTIDGNPLE